MSETGPGQGPGAEGLVDYVTDQSTRCSAQPRDRSSKVCGVCGEAARGYHFGGLCCDSCKAFFRRSVQSGMWEAFLCVAPGSCSTLRDNRRSCQACRFKKCRDIGMEPGLVMGEGERKALMARRVEKRRRHLLLLLREQQQQQGDQTSPDQQDSSLAGEQQQQQQQGGYDQPSLPARLQNHADHQGLARYPEPDAVDEDDRRFGEFDSYSQLRSHAKKQQSRLVEADSGGGVDCLTEEDRASIKVLKGLLRACLTFSEDEMVKKQETGGHDQLQNLLFLLCRGLGRFYALIPHFRALDAQQQGVMLKKAVAQGMFIYGAHQYCLEGEWWPRRRLAETCHFPRVTLGQLGAVVSCTADLRHIATFMSKYCSFFADETVTLLSMAIALYNHGNAPPDTHDVKCEPESYSADIEDTKHNPTLGMHCTNSNKHGGKADDMAWEEVAVKQEESDEYKMDVTEECGMNARVKTEPLDSARGETGPSLEALLRRDEYLGLLYRYLAHRDSYSSPSDIVSELWACLAEVHELASCFSGSSMSSSASPSAVSPSSATSGMTSVTTSSNQQGNATSCSQRQRSVSPDIVVLEEYLNSTGPGIGGREEPSDMSWQQDDEWSQGLVDSSAFSSLSLAQDHTYQKPYPIISSPSSSSPTTFNPPYLTYSNLPPDAFTPPPEPRVPAHPRPMFRAPQLLHAPSSASAVMRAKEVELVPIAIPKAELEGLRQPHWVTGVRGATESPHSGGNKWVAFPQSSDSSSSAQIPLAHRVRLNREQEAVMQRLLRANQGGRLNREKQQQAATSIQQLPHVTAREILRNLGGNDSGDGPRRSIHRQIDLSSAEGGRGSDRAKVNSPLTMIQKEVLRQLGINTGGI